MKALATQTLKKFYTPEIKRQQQTILTRVNLAELTRVEKRLVQLESQELQATKKTDVFFTNKKGFNDLRTLGHFLQKGLPHTTKGLNTFLKCNDWELRIKQLQNLEAYYQVFKETSLRFDEVTPEILTSKKQEIQNQIQFYQPMPF